MRMCELLVGLPDVVVLGVDDVPAQPIRIHVETVSERPGCSKCGVLAYAKERAVVDLIDLPAFGRPARLVWHKRRWTCTDSDCAGGSWTEIEPRIAYPRQSMSDRAGRWVTEQVGRHARSVNEVAKDLGCDWHTVNDAVLSYGEALVEDPARYGAVRALGMDEVLFVRRGTYRSKEFTTQLVDVEATQLLDVVPGRSGTGPKAWLEEKSEQWRAGVEVGTLDLSGPYRAVFDEKLPHVTQVADPFHVVKHANAKLDECRRRVQNDTMGHRGRKDDPLYRCRRLLTKAHERLDAKGEGKLLGLLEAGDPEGEVTTAWHAKEAVREIYAHSDGELAAEWIDELIVDMAERGQATRGPFPRPHPQEVEEPHRGLAHREAEQRTDRSGQQPHQAGQARRLRLQDFRNYRVRSLLYAGKPNWALLATVTPR